jgi:hypothetical protein
MMTKVMKEKRNKRETGLAERPRFFFFFTLKKIVIGFQRVNAHLMNPHFLKCVARLQKYGHPTCVTGFQRVELYCTAQISLKYVKQT